ncbi:cell division protein ZapC [Ferrimonas sediminum]|uniref:Cell division protein ZapC n=1 Tax=Ferrimonas sediminum TaxID=718193 RepID=A0A1G8VW85_9GAMM|nr:cell division protein ZapC [Ferrimonas sediminum]SDJ70312.1 cell division protein ZapC [Ferrimonas sediminum]
MLLMPTVNWRWFFEPQHSRLALDLGDEMVFVTPYDASQIIPDALQGMVFSTEHADCYTQLLSELGNQLTLSEPQQVQIAINATALAFFALPRMPKSWYFHHSNNIVYSRVGKLCQLDTDLGSGLFMVVQSEERSSLVMLLSEPLSLSASKTLPCFQPIKVMNDRLVPAQLAKRRAHSAA